MMEIRPLTRNDMDQARALWETCFEDIPAFLDWYFQIRFQPEDGLGVFLDGRLVCDLHLAPREIKLRNQTYSSAYLIALATAPAFRRQGLAKKLLTYALRHLAAKGIGFTFLLPFNTEFYTRLGWGEWADHRLYHLPTAYRRRCHPDPTATSNSPWRFRQVKPEQTLLAEIYEHSFANFDGGLYRSVQDWTCLLLDHTLYGGKTWLATDLSGVPQGYALVLPSVDGRPVLRELTTFNPALKTPFIDFLAAELARASRTATAQTACADTGINQAKETCAIRAYSPGQLRPYIPPGTQPFFLGRITNTQLMLEARCYPPLTGTWVMEITDPLLPENSGQYQIILDQGAMRVTKTTGHKQVALRCSIGTLARLVTGNARPQELVHSGDLTLDHPESLTLLDTLFPPATNWVNEYF